MSPPTRPTHVLFDFFGTLVDYSASRTEQGYERSHALLRAAGSSLDYGGFLALWSEVSDAHEAEAERSLREYAMRDVTSAFLRQALPMPDPTLVDPFVETYLAEWSKAVRYPAGLREMLTRLLNHHRLAVITNTHDPALVPTHLARMGVANLLAPVVTSVELGWRKPSPRIFEHALERIGARPEECLYVGDSYIADYRGALAAGLRAWLIDPERRTPVPDENRIDSVLDVERRLSRLATREG